MGDYDPYAHAAALGIEVIHRPIRTANGRWFPQHNTIVIREGLRAVIDRSTLAHELGHATLGHVADSAKNETQADRIAADNLIRYAELLKVTQWTTHHNTIAKELGVTGRILRVYLDAHNLDGSAA
ncbi:MULTISPECIES: ImmA/IrrE family metallo-endopeptidase [Cryobacterium]|uniref:ImmA/IrrE family metallo-endopeptidase n=1 Tax=Cryobacterium TaxID=69578 RepID=UPI000CD44753|nr:MULTISPECIES: ImmA/IrrE family metallo-endopeptidase [Cryobacterium]POH63605.1 ImmA/IrrE family metallo-endopeptidase [Cryobacterium zongtaii]TFC44077.1 ImmA/IrrE family metallo-endopeptidase [Cryobacterium sp. TMN-39-2]